MRRLLGPSLLLLTCCNAYAEEAAFIPAAPVADRITSGDSDEDGPLIRPQDAITPAQEKHATQDNRSIHNKANAHAFSAVARSDDDLVLVELRVGRNVLNEAIPGYVTKSGLLLPLGQIADALQFPIRVNPSEGIADGWFLARTNRFLLDMPHQEAVIAGNRSGFTPAQIERHDDDIYVDTALLGQWFNIEFAFSFATQSVTVSGRNGTKLPIELTAERNKAHALLSRRGEEAELHLPKRESPYRLFSMPVADLTYNGLFDNHNNQAFRNDMNAVLANDLLYMRSNLFVLASDQNNGIDDVRWTLSRKHPDGQLFSEEEATSSPVLRAANALDVRELSLGDTYTQQLPLTAYNQQGRGIVISSKPYDRASQFDRTSLQGDLPPGWDVELYRNDELLDFQRASSDGRYQFIDVPLLSGLNILRLVFYGPFGQTREEVQRFLVSGDLAEPGKSYFSISLTQQNSGLFTAQTQPLVPASSFGSGVSLNNLQQSTGKERVLLDYEYGLSRSWSLFSNLAHLTTPDGVTRDYLGAGIATTLAGAYIRLDAAHDAAQGGNSWQLAVQDTLWGLSLSAQHQQFYDFISEFTETIDDPVTMRSTIRADAPVSVPWLPRLNIGASALRQAYASGRVRSEISNRIATAIGRTSFSHTLNWRSEQNALLPGLRRTTGDVIVSTPYRRLILRGGLQYSVRPAPSLDTLAATVEYNVNRDLLTRLEVNRQMGNQAGDSAVTNYIAGINRRFTHYSLGVNASHGDDGVSTVGLSLSLSLGQDPRNGHILAFPDTMARDGLVSARLFNDRNLNTVFDDGDTPIEHGRFRVNRGGGNVDTDKDGTVLLRNLPPDLYGQVSLDNSSLENPYLTASVPGASLLTRPGTISLLDIPVTPTSDAEGTVYILQADGSKKTAANVQLELVNSEGNVVRDTRSAFDGYYLFESVAPGRYTLRLAPEQQERLNLHSTSRELSVTGQEEIMGGLDMVLRMDKQ